MEVIRPSIAKSVLEWEADITDMMTGQASAERQQFMYHFMESSGAWSPSIELFKSRNEQVRYFSANVIYTKVCKQLSQINEAQQADLLRILVETLQANSLVQGSSSQRAFLDRLILSLAAVTVLFKEGSEFLRVLNESIAVVRNSANHADTVALNLELIAKLSAEIDAADLSRHHRTKLEDISKDAIRPVLDALAGAVSVRVTGQLVQNLVLAGLRVVKCWAPRGISLTLLCHPKSMVMASQNIFGALIAPALGAADLAMAKEACIAMREVLRAPETDFIPACVSNFSATHSRAESLHAFLATLTETWIVLMRCFGNSSEEGETAAEIVNLLVEIGISETDQLCSPEMFEAAFFEKLLSIASVRPRRLAVVTYDVWLNIQEIPFDSRHPYTHQEVFYHLLEKLIQQIIFPSGFKGWDADVDYDDDEDDFEEFRSSKGCAVEEVLTVCYHALQGKFFGLLSRSMENNRNEGQWQHFEVVLYILYLIMNEVKASLNHMGTHTQEVLDFMYSLLKKVLLYQPDSSQCPPQLVTTSCAFIGSMTFLLTSSKYGNTFQSCLVPAMEFAFRSLWVAPATEKASKTILQLCVHGAPQLLSNESTIQGLVLGITTAISRPEAIDLEATQRVCEAVVRCAMCSHSSFELASATLEMLGGTLVSQLNSSCEIALAHPPGSAVPLERAQMCLACLARVIKFCDAAPSRVTGEHSLQPLLTATLPSLSSIMEAPMLVESEVIVGATFDVYSKCVTSGGMLMLAQLDSLVEAAI